MNGINLKSLINLEEFQKTQDDIALATGLAVIMVDYKGNPLTRHSNCSSFCKKIRENSELNDLCEKCDSRGGLESARIQDAYSYRCHASLIDFAVPIIIDEQYVGALMAGQVRVEVNSIVEHAYGNNPHIQFSEDFEMIVSKRYQFDFDRYIELKPLYETLPTMSRERIEAIARMMQYFISFFIDEAVLKQEICDEVEDVKLYYSTRQANEENVLDPAIKYIQENPNKKIHLEDMAKLCNISASYLSRIFKKIVGENFSSFVNHVKLDRAVDMLLNTNSPIVNISYDLGFDDCGYFIKLFKKKYELTPAAYRKTLKEKCEPFRVKRQNQAIQGT